MTKTYHSVAIQTFVLLVENENQMTRTMESHTKICIKPDVQNRSNWKFNNFKVVPVGTCLQKFSLIQLKFATLQRFKQVTFVLSQLKFLAFYGKPHFSRGLHSNAMKLCQKKLPDKLYIVLKFYQNRSQ